MLHIEYEYDHNDVDGNDIPYANSDRVILCLNLESGALRVFNNGVEENDIIRSQNLHMIWIIPKNLSIYTINTMLNEIEPFVNTLLRKYVKKYADSYIILKNGEIVYSITKDIIASYENREIEVSRISSEEFFDNYECPSYIYKFVNDADYYKSGKCIIEDGEDAYENRMNRFIKDVNLKNLETATETIKKIYQSYVRDGYENEFWHDFILRLNCELEYPEFKLMVSGHTLYYDYKKKIAINLN